MKDPVWIEKEDCLGFHSELLARFGGLDGLRDAGLLESALGRPLQLLHYGNPSLFELAASYAHGIVKNHPFLDGNKRSGLMAAALFLELNGWVFHAPEADAVLQSLALAAGELDAPGFAAWLEQSCSSR
jgi:death-on-curing protein